MWPSCGKGVVAGGNSIQLLIAGSVGSWPMLYVYVRMPARGRGMGVAGMYNIVSIHGAYMYMNTI